MRPAWGLVLSLALYGASFGLPVLRIEPGPTEFGDRGERTVYGLGAFVQAAVLVGFTPIIGVWGVVGLLSWCANVCYWLAGLAWANRRFWRAAGFALASAALGLVGLPLFWAEDHFDRGRWLLLGYWAWLGSFALLGLAAAWAGAAADKAAGALAGRWRVVGVEADGRAAAGGEAEGTRWSIRGGEVRARDPGGAERRMAFTLAPWKSPREIDVTALDGPEKGRTRLGIYDLTAGRLRVCLRDWEAGALGRPPEFGAGPGSGLRLITLGRAKQT